jgi:hypothetical protein
MVVGSGTYARWLFDRALDFCGHAFAESLLTLAAHETRSGGA